MKRSFCFFLLLFLVFSFCACKKLPNMSEILTYQRETLTFNIVINDDARHAATVDINNGMIRLTLCENTLCEGISFLCDKENTLTLSFKGTEFVLPDSDLIKAKKWCSLFCLPSDGLWKIEKETLGGITVFVCTETGTNITLYVDAATRLPLKIQSDKTEIDILDVTTDK